MKLEYRFILLLSLFNFNFLLPSLSAKSNGVCISPGGRFRPFSLDGKPPKKVRDINLCRMFRQRTCCDVSQTHQALLHIRRLASTGEANQECLQLWELLECSICDPNVGVHPGPPLICASFCDQVFQACSGAYFSMDAAQVLAPCGVNDFVCGRASEWISNGTELCRTAGFSVKQFEDSVGGDGRSCYGGKASLDSISKPWKGSGRAFKKDAKLGLLDDFRQWLMDMAFREKVCWAVGGMVLTAGLFFTSKRKSYNQRQRQAAVQRTGRKLGGKIGQRTPINQGRGK